jgi:hypothetical protein
MSAFTFPLPPPPPPPSAAGPQSTEQGHRGGFQNRGFRGKGRGNSRGGFNQGNNRGGFNRGGHQQHFSQNHLSNGYPTSKNASWAQPTATQVPSFQAMQPVISNGYATSCSTTPGQYPNLASSGSGIKPSIAVHRKPHNRSPRASQKCRCRQLYQALASLCQPSRHQSTLLQYQLLRSQIRRSNGRTIYWASRRKARFTRIVRTT